MYDGTVLGSPLNTFALNGAAYNVEASGNATSKATGMASLILRNTVFISEKTSATGQFNFTQKTSFAGEDTSLAVGTLSANKRVQANSKSTSVSSALFTPIQRRSSPFVSLTRSSSALNVNRRTSANVNGTITARNAKSRLIRRQSLSLHTIVLTIASANARSLARISGVGVALSNQKLDALRRISVVSIFKAKATQRLIVTRRINVRWTEAAKLIGRIGLPHIRFEAIDDYRSLQIATDLRRFTVRHSNDRLIVPTDKRSTSVYRSDRSIVVPSFEEGK